MKLINIPFFYKRKIVIPKKLMYNLPLKVMLFTTAQYVNQISSIKNQLEQNGKIVLLKKLNHTNIKGQILGCNILEIKGDFEAFLYIGEGKFHPKALTYVNKKDVFCFDPIALKYNTIKYDSQSTKIKNAKIAKFLFSENIGVLFTVKPGQFKDFKLDILKKKFKDKKFYPLINDSYNFSELEDFRFIDCFVNTACPRIGVDDFDVIQKPIMNLFDIMDI